MKGTQQSANPA